MVVHDVDENAPWRNDPIAKDLALAVRDWNIHNRKGKEEIKHQQTAVIAYGKALLKGRKEYPSNKAFKKWVLEWDFNTTYPFNNPRERSEAMSIAEIIFRTGTEDCFAECKHTVPSNMMTWARKTKLAPIKRRNPEAASKARAQIRVAVENGKPVNRDAVSEATGLSNGAVGRATAMEQARLEGVTEGEAIALNEQGNFTKAQDKHVQALIKKFKRDLDAQFAAAVDAEVDKKVKARKAMLESARAACIQQRNDAFKDQQHWKTLINNRKPLFTIDEFRSIVIALHPDNSASEETRARALQSFTGKKLQLTGKP